MDDCKWCFEKNLLSLQKFDASNRSSKQTVPKNYSTPKENIKTTSTPKEQLFAEGSCSQSHP